jgi:hypothetical protein
MLGQLARDVRAALARLDTAARGPEVPAPLAEPDVELAERPAAKVQILRSSIETSSARSPA